MESIKPATRGIVRGAMIRRHVGSEWWLVAQHDHALLAGELARHLGGAVQALSAEAVEAIAQHDAGWQAIHDDTPTINDRGQPLDVFETPLALGVRIWRESSKLAMRGGEYVGLLVSLHSLGLSALAASRALPPKAASAADLKLQFDLNKFQHAEVEQQELCRERLGLRVDAPLTLGLAQESLDPSEQQLAFDFHWMQAMDRLSLDLCCTHPPFGSIGQVTTGPLSGAELHLTVSRTGPASACVSPWPFASPRLAVTIPFRRIPAAELPSDEALRRLHRAAAVESLTLTLDPPAPLAATA